MSAVEQLSFDGALAAREQGISAVIEHAGPTYRDRIIEAIEVLAANGLPFDADSVRELVGETPAAESPNLIGALFARASTRGLIQFEGFTRSVRKVGHGNRLAVWRGVS
jgi:hypothetical protein